MANFGGLILTQRGRNLLAKALTGVTLEFTRVGVGSGSWGTTPPAELLDLANETASLAIQDMAIVGDGTTRLRAILTNSGLQTGYWLREVGIFAADPDLGEILYAASTAGDLPDYIPAAGTIGVEEIFNLYAVIGAAQSVTVVIDGTAVLLTPADLDLHNAGADAHPALIAAHNADADAHPALIAAHNAGADAHGGLQAALAAHINNTAAHSGGRPGDFVVTGRSSPASDELACNGAAVSRAAYADLFSAIGTYFGAGDGTTTFNVPNIPAGYTTAQQGGDLGGTSAGQIISHTHSVSALSGACSLGGGGPCGYGSYNTFASTSGTGTSSNGGNANLPAAVRVNYFIRF